MHASPVTQPVAGLPANSTPAGPEPRLPLVDQRVLPYFDYTALPLAAEVAMFRNLGQQLLGAVLRQEPLPPLPALLTLEQAQVNRPQLIWPRLLRRYHTYGQQGFFDDLGLILRDSLRQLRQRRWRASYQSVQQWPPRFRFTMLVNRLERALGTVSAEAMPDDLWALLAESAWGDLTFQHALASQFRAYLRQTVLFTQRDKALVLLSPNTFWVLLALAANPMRFSLEYFTRDYWWQRWAAQRLQQAAAHQIVSTEGWADFWDQWVIWQGMALCPDAVVRLNPLLYNALTALPIFQWTAPPTSRPALRDQSDAVDESADIVALIAGSKPVSGSTPILSTPTWQAAIPAWFYLQYVQPMPENER